MIRGGIDLGSAAGGAASVRQRWLSLLLFGLTSAIAALGLMFLALSWATPVPDTWGFQGAGIILAAAFAGLGLLLAQRRPENAIGWLFLLSGLVAAVTELGTEYAGYAVLTLSGSLPGGLLAAWAASWVWGLMIGLLFYAFLLFPTGRLLSDRWRPVAWLVVSGFGLMTFSFMLRPGPLYYAPYLNNPIALDAVLAKSLQVAGSLGTALSAILVVTCLVQRLRRSTGVERQQVKWFAYATAMMSIIGLINVLGVSVGPVGKGPKLFQIFTVLVWLALPATVVLAILRHRLYDIDRLINRTFVYGTLSAGVIVSYILLVGLLGALLKANANLAAAVVTVAVTALLFRPSLARLQRAVERVSPGPPESPSVDRRMPGKGRDLPSIERERVGAATGDQVQEGGRGAGRSAQETTSQPRWLALAQALWVVCAAAALAVFIASIPRGYALYLSGSPGDISIDAPAAYVAAALFAQALFSMLAASVSLALAGVLFCKKRREPITLFVSFSIMAYGILLCGPLEALNSFPALVPGAPQHSGMLVSADTILLIQSAALGLPLPLLFYLFPNGRFVPSWTRYGAALLALLSPGLIFVLPGEWPSGWPPIAPLLIAIFIVLLAVGVYSQIHRYRRVASPDERQQTKWVVFGLILFLGTLAVLQIPYAAVMSVPPGDAYPWWEPLSSLAWWITLTILPISLSVGVMRYRLWDIDILINRTLVYGTLTACIIAVYIIMVGVAGTVLRTNSSTAGFVAATVLALLLFRPLQSRLQHGVDRVIRGVPRTPPQAETDSLRGDSPGTPHRRWLGLAHGLWLICAAVAFFILLVAVPLGYAPYVGQAAESRVAILYLLSASVSFLVGFISIALSSLLFWRKRDEPIALLASFYLLVHGIASAGPLEVLGDSHTLPVTDLIGQVANSLFFLPVLFLYLFPNGRFVPAWTRWAAVVLVGTIPLVFSFGASPRATVSDLRLGFILIAFLVLVAIGVYAQVYRYRRVATAIERQQIKWGAFGVALYLLIFGLTSVPYVLIAGTTTGAADTIWTPLGDILWWLFMGILPFTLAVAVMRYRLWDVDILINRTLVYGALTAGIVAVYILLVGTLSAFSQTSGSILISLLATGMIAFLFQPLRERLQRGVNRLMYGERDEPHALIARLGQHLETTIAPDTMLDTLVRTTAQALKLPYVAVETDRSGSPEIAASYGQPSPNARRIPLAYQADTVSNLLVAPRGPNEPLSAADLNLLRMIAQQAGMAFYAVQLTADLQHSRARLVTAREEERRRIRRDLHDGLGPALAAQILKVGIARAMLAQNPTAADAMLVELESDVEKSLADIRRLVYALRPPELDQLGLLGAIRETLVRYGTEREAQSTEDNGNHLNIQLDLPQQLPPLPAAVEVAAYRIVQEALTNVVRHSRAQTCFVKVQLNGNLQITVSDDGQGPRADSKHGVGLASMRERATELGGTCSIEPGPDGGTRVQVELPLILPQAEEN